MQAVDQHRRRRVALQDQPSAKLGQNGLARRKLRASRSRRYAHAVAMPYSRLRSPGRLRRDMPIQPLRFAIGSNPSEAPTVSAPPSSRMPFVAQREVEQGDYLGLRRRSEIDEQVAARNHVEP